jgi:sorbitol-specific phosphotransferase system component IIC
MSEKIQERKRRTTGILASTSYEFVASFLLLPCLATLLLTHPSHHQASHHVPRILVSSLERAL